MAYTPGTSFTFAGGAYTPSTAFTLGETGVTLTGALSGTLDGVTGQINARAYANAGTVSGTLAGVSGAMLGAVAPQGVLSATLDSIAGQFVGAVVPQGVFAAALDDLSGAFTGNNVANAGRINATLEGVGGYLFGHYDSNVPRYTVAAVHCRQQDAQAAPHGAAIPIQQTLAGAQDWRISRQPATPDHTPVGIDVEQTLPLPIHRCGTVVDATPLSRATTAEFDLLAWLTSQRALHAEQAQARTKATTAVAQQMTKIRRPDWRQPVQDMAQTRHDFLKALYGDAAGAYTPGATFSLFANPNYAPDQPFVWTYAPTVTQLALRHIKGLDGVSFLSPLQQAGLAPVKRCIPVQQARRPPPGTSVPIDPERPPYEPPPGHTTITIPTQTVYIMQHVISVKTVPGNVDVPVGQVSLSYDADSFAWQFSGTLLDPDTLSLVQASGGAAVTLAVTIDGYLWHVLVESIEHGIQFAKHSISLRGRSLTALLAAPYVMPTSFTTGSDMTVQQLADSLMPVGWSIVWDAPTWLVPAGAFSYTNQTPIQVLAGLVNDIGCVAVPHASLQQITVQPRYPVYPWYFSSAPVDLAIPEAALKAVNLRPSIASQANGVYVHGGDIGGVLGWCRLAGTDGARLAPTVSNALMTNVIGCRLLGERILSGQQEQPVIKSATLPLNDSEFPLATVGQLVGITLGGTVIKGVINSVAIEASLASVSQTIQIGEETANVWTAFNSLMPRDPLLVGSIASTDGNVSVITLLDGGVVSVRGTGTVGNKVYIRAGRIEGTAPTMTQNEIVV